MCKRQIGERYKNFEDLPPHIRKAMKTLGPGNLDEFIRKPISSLGGTSILKILNEKGEKGEKRIIDLLNEFLGLYGGRE